ncbi:MAG TPA: hypothetical protein DCK76_01735 [Desulfotomaculum sp.]|nr:MAG: hypothetical protein XD78_1899 [Desulfotomaculum sp. 46_296]HAG10122.1 hypothetical protein [Desulfotomaculum sp.]HBY03778.1 hypothetical protein [Desulfotomaculum sp.]
MQVKANQDIREAIKDAGLFQWQVADRYGIHEQNFCKLLRKELPDKKKQPILKAIKELQQEVN